MSVESDSYTENDYQVKVNGLESSKRVQKAKKRVIWGHFKAEMSSNQFELVVKIFRINLSSSSFNTFID